MTNDKNKILLLDGATGTELDKRGVDITLPLWSARAMIDAPDALLKESSLTTVELEYRMRVRVSLRAMWALVDMRHLLNICKFPLFSWQLLSHKVLRYLAFNFSLYGI